ncbi:hypothetical protein I7I50_05888 [Histoplasma capsulatum G186AR]|uniref:Uncharacterized protein n=1 Tax=Ajellomyces capsulatus TaxID=5037 RepID=A0A8H7ZD00_AJECA|nr:hypothetical protein I7I52_04147 [Histoplasma capsulatum]QSS76435.1 hypothetical protein I7I50_05888 [Histoplasma capsulatum G186AR]
MAFPRRLAAHGLDKNPIQQKGMARSDTEIWPSTAHYRATVHGGYCGCSLTNLGSEYRLLMPGVPEQGVSLHRLFQKKHSLPSDAFGLQRKGPKMPPRILPI